MPKHPDCKLTCEAFVRERREGELCGLCNVKGVQCFGGEHPSQTENIPPTVPDHNLFKENLNKAGVQRPDERVLERIALHYNGAMRASIGNPNACLELYRIVKDLPSTVTRGCIQAYLNVAIKESLSLLRPNILQATDNASGHRYLLKSLRPTNPQCSSVPEADVSALVSSADIDGLVTYECVEVSVPDTERGETRFWIALKMRHYLSSLEESPKISETLLFREFTRVLEALKRMHDDLRLVHMDVKSSNIFLDENSCWHVGDFGSTVPEGSSIVSFTEVYNPYRLSRESVAIPSMDIVQLCVMVAVELDRDSWRERLCGDHHHVQAGKILAELAKISIKEFKELSLSLFQQHYNMVISSSIK